ncbi:THAP domain-containing protein 1-like isoform X2 [Haliotis asinina]|uniref:THAP domain-containing protein 1-like isoform X2 n=1 Tax=Haliotis asinina TaxID=109174 RepID=UPI00353256E3
MAEDDDAIVLSFNDSLIRQGDLRLLEDPGWLNDTLIGFCFELYPQRWKSVVCSKHFRPEDYKYTPVRRTLKQGSVPSIFPWTLENMKSRKAPAIRHPLMPKNSNSSESPTSSLLDCDPHEEEEDSLSAQTQTDVSLPDTQHLLKRILELEKEKDLLKQQLTIERFGLERFAGNDDLIQYYTSFRS